MPQMKQRLSRSRKALLATLACAPLVFLIGCNPSVRDLMQQAYAEDPPVMPEYQPDGSRFLKTRNIVLDATYEGRQLTSLVMVVAVPGQGAVTDSAAAQGALIKFRSVAPNARFMIHHELTLNLAGQVRNFGDCRYEREDPREGRVTEEMTAIVPREVVSSMAGSNDVAGTIGQVAFHVSGEQLGPVKALADTVRAR